MAKKKNSKILSVISITASLLGIAHNGMYGGAHDSWQITLPIVGAGLLMAIIALGLKRTKLSWVALVISAVSLLLFFIF